MANNGSGDDVKTPKEIYKRDLQSRAKRLAVFRCADFVLVRDCVCRYISTDILDMIIASVSEC